MCNYCDNLTSMKGHAVENGTVVACPFISLRVHLNGKPA